MRSSLSIVFVGLSALAIAACGGTGSGNPYSGGTGGHGGTGGVLLDCSTLSTPPLDCDKPCTSDSQCSASFCNNGKCIAHCTAEEGCGSSATCNVSGRCVMGTGGTGGTGNTGGSSCQSVTITPTRSIPNVMFLVDQSGSMVEGFSGGQDRWEAAHSAITDIVSDLDSIVRFGLTTYTSQNGNQNPPCPRLPTQVDFAFDNAGTIGNQSVYPSSYPSQDGDDTPTGDSIDALVSVIQANPPPAEGPTIIVLATDGEPDSCEYPDPTTNSQRTFSRNEAVSAAGNAHDAGMDLFVLWVGALTDPAIEAHIQDVANAGVGQSGAPFWVGDDPSSLQGAFQQIISDSISCDIQMDKQFDDVDKACDEGNVRLNGTKLDCPSEWRVKPGVNNVIELVGSACQTFKSGSSTFSAVFPCGAIVVE